LSLPELVVISGWQTEDNFVYHHSALLIALSYSYDDLLTAMNDESRRERAALQEAERGNGDPASEDGVDIAADVRLGEVSNGNSIILE
jgi:hypothetical protein